MSATLASVLAAAESLPAPQRRELIELLLQGLEEDASNESDAAVPPLSEAWKVEIARRSAEYDAGRADSVSWEEVKERWRLRRAASG